MASKIKIRRSSTATDMTGQTLQAGELAWVDNGGAPATEFSTFGALIREIIFGFMLIKQMELFGIQLMLSH